MYFEKDERTGIITTLMEGFKPCKYGDSTIKYIDESGRIATLEIYDFMPEIKLYIDSVQKLASEIVESINRYIYVIEQVKSNIQNLRRQVKDIYQLKELKLGTKPAVFYIEKLPYFIKTIKGAIECVRKLDKTAYDEEHLDTKLQRVNELARFDLNDIKIDNTIYMIRIENDFLVIYNAIEIEEKESNKNE